MPHFRYRLASHVSKAPVATFKAGLYTLAYLLGTAEDCLTYWKASRETWNEYKRFPDPSRCVEGFGDAFAPEARKSMQCLQIDMEGSLTAWSVGRQSFMAQSSCEAEIIALMDLANYTISMSFLTSFFNGTPSVCWQGTTWRPLPSTGAHPCIGRRGT